MLFPHSTLTWALFRDVLTLPYWQMLVATRSDTVLQAPPFDMHGTGLCTNDVDLYSNYTMVRSIAPFNLSSTAAARSDQSSVISVQYSTLQYC